MTQVTPTVSQAKSINPANGETIATYAFDAKEQVIQTLETVFRRSVNGALCRSLSVRKLCVILVKRFVSMAKRWHK